MGKKHRHKAKRKHGPKSTKTPSEHPQGEDGMVYTVKIEPHPDDEKKYSEDKQYRNDQIDAARRLNNISGIGAGIAGAALLALVVNACMVHRQLVAAKQANTISKTASDLAYRPYVGINDIVIAFVPHKVKSLNQITAMPTPETTVFDYRAELKNFGPVPGSNFRGSWRIFLSGVEQTSSGYPDMPATIFPGQSKFLSGQIGHNDYPALQRGEKVLILEISVDYTGPSGEYHYCEKERYAPEYRAFLSLGEDCTKLAKTNPN